MRPRDLIIGTLGVIAVVVGIGAASLRWMFLGIFVAAFAFLSVMHRKPGG